MSKPSEQGHWVKADYGWDQDDEVWVWDIDPETHALQVEGEYGHVATVPATNDGWHRYAPVVGIYLSYSPGGYRGTQRVGVQYPKVEYRKGQDLVRSGRRTPCKSHEDGKAKAERWLDRKVTVVAAAPTNVRALQNQFKAAASSAALNRSKIAELKRKIVWQEEYLAKAVYEEAEAKAEYVKACKAAGVEPEFEEDEI